MGTSTLVNDDVYLPLVSAGFALRLGRALEGATKPLLLIALQTRIQLHTYSAQDAKVHAYFKDMETAIAMLAAE